MTKQQKQPQPASKRDTALALPGPDTLSHRLITASVLMAGLVLILSMASVRAVWGQETPPETAEKAPVTPETKTQALGSSSPTAKTPSKGSGKGPRTLDEINIEGEIAVPQVLFITARERKHYQDYLHRKYLKGSQELCRETRIPTRLGSWLRP